MSLYLTPAMMEALGLSPEQVKAAQKQVQEMSADKSVSEQLEEAIRDYWDPWGSAPAKLTEHLMSCFVIEPKPTRNYMYPGESDQKHDLRGEAIDLS